MPRKIVDEMSKLQTKAERINRARDMLLRRARMLGKNPKDLIGSFGGIDIDEVKETIKS